MHRQKTPPLPSQHLLARSQLQLAGGAQGAAEPGHGRKPGAQRTGGRVSAQWGRSPGPGGSLVGGPRCPSGASRERSGQATEGCRGGEARAPAPDGVGTGKRVLAGSPLGGHDRCLQRLGAGYRCRLAFGRTTAKRCLPVPRSGPEGGVRRTRREPPRARRAL